MKQQLLLLTFCFSFFIILGQTTFKDKVTIDNATGDTPYSIDSGFIDGDAYADIVIALLLDGTQIKWYRNNGNKTFAAATTINTSLDNITNVKLVDLNNDGSLDLLATGFNNNRLVWFPNDGNGNFATENLISSAISGASDTVTGKVDNNETIDIIVSATTGNSVFWFSNDGSGNFTGPNTLDNTVSRPGFMDLKDIDNDNDLDLLLVSSSFSAVDVAEIFRNDGNGNFTKDSNSVTSGKTFIFNGIFANLDNDGNQDILLTELNLDPSFGKFFWIEEDGMGGFTETEITTSIGNPSSVKFVDLDQDNLDDIVLSSGRFGTSNDIVWFKNNGDGTFADEALIDDTQNQAYFFTVADFDNDSDLDIASNDYNLANLNWLENELFNLSLEENQEKLISVYPNPAINKLYFKNLEENIEVTIIDILGKQVMHAEVKINEPLDVSFLNSGLYTLKFKNSNEVIKLLKQ